MLMLAPEKVGACFAPSLFRSSPCPLLGIGQVQRHSYFKAEPSPAEKIQRPQCVPAQIGLVFL